MDNVPQIYPIGGYAPGNYRCTCINCKQHFNGDKRAVQCEPCAVKLKQYMTLNDKLYDGIYDRIYPRESECGGHQDAADFCEKVCDEFTIAFVYWIYQSHPGTIQELIKKFKTEVYGK